MWLRTILAAPRAKNPCGNRKKYVKYLLTKRMSTGGPPVGDAWILITIIGGAEGSPGQRCIIPALGFYGWHVGANGTKRPFYIHLEDQETDAD
jgi:hypothetical protein